jgi:hypothetical protein
VAIESFVPLTHLGKQNGCRLAHPSGASPDDEPPRKTGMSLIAGH